MAQYAGMVVNWSMFVELMRRMSLEAELPCVIFACPRRQENVVSVVLRTWY